MGTGSAGAPEMAKGRSRALRVWIVEDHDDLRVVLQQCLDQQPGINCRRQFPSAESVLASLAEERPPDILLMDVNLGGQTGLDAIRPALKLAPSLKIVIMTTFTSSRYELEAHRAGAAGFVLKTYEIPEIVDVLRKAYRTPGNLELFPNIQYPTTAPVPAEAAKTKYSFIGALRQLCRVNE